LSDIQGNLSYLDQQLKIIMASQADLDAAIAALPGAIETALQPIIAAIEAKAGSIDFTPEINSLNAIPAAVAAAVTPAAPAAPAA
jgi:hypothetical protein